MGGSGRLVRMRKRSHKSFWWPILNAAFLLASAQGQPSGAGATNEPVGRDGEGRTVLPVNQVVTPLGRQIDLPGMRPQAIALSPDGKVLAVSGKTSELLVLDAGDGTIRQRVALPNEGRNEPVPDAVSPNILEPDKKGQLSYTGLIFSGDGKRLFLSNVNGSIKVFTVDAAGQVTPSHSLALPPAKAPRRENEIPSGLALSADSGKLYVCGNLSNTLLEMDSASGKVLRTFAVGVAPYEVVIKGGKAYVSNWGGRRPGAGDLTGPAGRGTVVRVDPVRHIANEGSVSVIDLGGNQAVKEIPAGLHSSALALSPDGDFLVCANAAADNFSVIDTRTDAVVETIQAKASPSDLIGATPNALAFSQDGRTLYAANGTQNAIAVIDFDPEDKESKLLGLIPVGWFPGGLAFDAGRGTLAVANIKGHPALKKKDSKGAAGFNSHHYSGSVSLVPLPKAEALPKLSETVMRNLRRGAIVASQLPPRPDQPARPVPERIGEPSVFKHVVYVIKENRTYDQVLGDLPQGKGEASLCIFGEEITPNLHRMARDFVLLDNTYCSGILSADGHQWSASAFSTDYMEKSFAGFPRSYPDGMGEDDDDALAYSPAGFLWDNAIAHGVSMRNYGEFCAPDVKWKDGNRRGSPGYMDCYRTWKGETDEVSFGSAPMIPSLEAVTAKGYVGWSMEVPDQYRADFVIRELREAEAKGEWPALILICLPNDHTSGTSKDSPTPASHMADNDLAFGRIVEAISHSKFWPETCILAIEDDPQAGWDHVSGYRTTAYCISPYTKRKTVVSTQYNTTSVIRTIEQILGLPPMNQFDASATPLFDCFTEQADFTPYTALANKVPLAQLNPGSKTILHPQLRKDAELSSTLNFREVDKAPEDVLNRILWRALKGVHEPYPEWAITAGADDDDEEEQR